jgi:hypothetical protein
MTAAAAAAAAAVAAVTVAVAAAPAAMTAAAVGAAAGMVAALAAAAAAAAVEVAAAGAAAAVAAACPADLLLADYLPMYPAVPAQRQQHQTEPERKSLHKQQRLLLFMVAYQAPVTLGMCVMGAVGGGGGEAAEG